MNGALRCAVCSGTEHVSDPHPELLRCRSCGHRFYRGIADVDPARVYGDEYHTSGEYLDYAGQRETLARNFRDYLHLMYDFGARGGRLLEAGCAYGFFLAEAGSRFEVARGLDVSEPAVAWARERLAVSAQTGELPGHHPDEPYDVVCLWDTIEHLPDPALHVGAAAGVLRPGGLLFLTTGDAGSIAARVRGSRWRMIHPPTHLHYFTRAGIRRLLEGAGFRVLGIRSVATRRRVSNVLHNLDRFGHSRLVGAAARAVLRAAPDAVLRRDLRIGVGDVMFAAARLDRPASGAARAASAGGS